MHNSTRQIFAAIALTTAGLAACGAEEEDSIVYRLMPVAVRDVVVSANAEGTVEPIKTVEVKSKASGEIIEVPVDVGDAVRRGDVLVRVDPRVPRNAVTQSEADLAVAEAQLENAQSQLDRSERLYATGAITEQDWEKARLDHANAKARRIRAERTLEDDKIRFEDTEVRAAIDGIVLSRRVEVGTVIQSASSGVGGGAVLLTMANLGTVQVRSLVDETDIGKIEPGLDVTIVVDAYPDRPFRGRVLKIEPEALVVQNVTVFPVLMRIPNEDGLLRPGMNAEVEVHIAFREGALTVPNSALRTQRDLQSAADIMGFDMATIQAQLAAAREAASDQPEGVAMGSAASAEANTNAVTFNGRQIELPPGLAADEVRPVIAKIESQGFQAIQSFSAAERAIMQRLRGAMGGGGGPPRGGARRPDRHSSSQFQFGGSYVVFVMRGGMPEAQPVRTGLTDLDYSEIISGLTLSDTVLVLPSASLVQSQEAWLERANRFAGGGMFGSNR